MLKEPGLNQPGTAVNDRREPARKSRLTALAGAILALVGVGLILWLWDNLVNSGQWFSLFFAGLTAAAFLAAYFLPKPPLLRSALTVGGWFCLGLALMAGLGLGAYLPLGLADFLSPALGRFGGLAGLTVLTAVCLGRGVALKKEGWLDLAVFCGIGAVWVALNTAAQANFPQPPNTKDQWAGLLFSLFWIGLVSGLVALALSFVKEWRWTARTFWRWAVAPALAGLTLGLYFEQGAVALACGLELLAVALVLGYLGWRNRAGFKGKTLALGGLKQLGAAVLVIVGLALLYLPIGEQLETVLLRDTLEHYALNGWGTALGKDPGSPSGSIAGTVKDAQGQPVGGANIIVSDATGFAWTATSDSSGHYTLGGVPSGHYLPVAARSGFLDATATGKGPLGDWRMVASVRGGQTTSQVDFVMQARRPYTVVPGNTLKLGEFSEASRDNPVPSKVLRRTFTFENAGLAKAGLVYEPTPDQGKGPFPILLIVYPGPADGWEGVSIPLAAQGFVVIAYQPELFGPHPERGLNLRGDVSDMLELYNYAKAGYFSDRSDPSKVIVTGGSVSTAYTYLMLREIETSSPADKAALKGGIMYGGLADMYTYRYDWQRGALYIDPGIQALEGMLIALGRPDLRPEIYLLFSPVYHLASGSLPPLLLVHTSKDTIVPINQNTLLVNVLQKVGIAHTNVIYTDIEHYLDTSKPDPSQRDMLEKTIQFLKDVTK
jgi:hypothetical protein